MTTPNVEPLYCVNQLVDDQGNLWEYTNGEYSMVDNSGKYYYKDGVIVDGSNPNVNVLIDNLWGRYFRREGNNLFMVKDGGDLLISDQCELLYLLRDHSDRLHHPACIINGVHYVLDNKMRPLKRSFDTPRIEEIELVRTSVIITKSRSLFENIKNELVQCALPFELAFKVVDRVTEVIDRTPTDFTLDVDGNLWREDDKISHPLIEEVGILKLIEVKDDTNEGRHTGMTCTIRVGFIGRDENYYLIITNNRNIRITRWKLPFKLMVNSPNKPPMKSARSNIGIQ
jgi:hypothetical protein